MPNASALSMLYVPVLRYSCLTGMIKGEIIAMAYIVRRGLASEKARPMLCRRKYDPMKIKLHSNRPDIAAILAQTNPGAPKPPTFRNMYAAKAKHAENPPIHPACFRSSVGLAADDTKASLMPLNARKGM